jgi:hypothetical protein
MPAYFSLALGTRDASQGTQVRGTEARGGYFNEELVLLGNWDREVRYDHWLIGLDGFSLVLSVFGKRGWNGDQDGGRVGARGKCDTYFLEDGCFHCSGEAWGRTGD